MIKRLDGFSGRIEAMARGKIAFNKEFVGALTALTDTPDLEQQHRALVAMAKTRRDQHIDWLTDLAPDDLTAFAEVINPHEPPPPHLIFVADRLMEIEGGDRDRLILSMPPGHAKDLDVETPVLMGDGSWKRLGDVEVGDMVITIHGRAREVLAVHDQGVRPVLKITTMSGRSVRAHAEHQFLTPSEWLPASDLRVGFTLALPKAFEIVGSDEFSRDQFAFLGFMMARAVVTGRTYSRLKRITTKFRCDDPAILAEMKAVGARLGFTYRQSRKKSYGVEAVLLNFDVKCKDWLKQIGLYGIEKQQLRVPEWVFKGTEDRIAAFLGAVVSCDASFRPVVHGQTGRQRKLTMPIRENVGIAEDITRLFMRLGIKAGCVTSLQFYNYLPTEFRRIEVVSGADQALVARRIPIIGMNRRLWDLPINSGEFDNPQFHADKIKHIEEDGECETRCLTVEEDASFIANGIVVHNSTYGSRLYPAWYLGRKENRLYLQAGHTKDFAEKEFGRKTKDIINTDAYRRIFPSVAVRSDAKASGDWILTNGNRYVAKGVGEAISGFRSTNNGIDDPYPTFAAAQSPVLRNKVWNWFVNDFMTRLLPMGNAFVITTRWHMDDVVGRLQDMIESGEITDPWDFINLPVFCVDPSIDQMSRLLNEPLWPSFYTEATLLRQKALMSPSQWNSLYEGDPMPADGNVIKAKWLLSRYKMPPLLRANSIVGSLAIQEAGSESAPEESRDPASQNMAADSPNPVNGVAVTAPAVIRIIEQAPPYVRTVVSVDSAEKDTARADYSALTVWRETIDRRHYLVDAHRERMEFPDLLARVDQYAAMWEAEIVLMESKGAGNQFIQHVGSLEEPKSYVTVPIDPGKDGKIFRMDAVTPFFMANRVVLPERAAWLGIFEKELLQFPGSKNDDYADTVSQYLKWVRDMGAVRRGTKKLR